MKALQFFSKEYLERCKKMTPLQKLKFLDDFRTLYYESKPQKSKLISIKIPENLLSTFKARSELEDTPYQTQIKKLMKKWVNHK